MTLKHLMQAPRQRGFNLIEMMIAMTVGLLIIGALMAVIIGAGTSSKAGNRQSELQTNGRYALDVMRRDAQNAGYYGLTGRGITSNPNIPSIPAANDCLLGFALNISQRVWGANNGINPFNPATCPELANVQPNTDMLAVRYLSTSPVLLAPGAEGGPSPLPDCQAATGGLCFRSAYEQGMLFNAGTPAVFFDQPQQDHLVEVDLYYVNKNTVGADGIPSLRKYSLSPNGMMVDELVVSGVENLQVQYGVDSGLSGNPAGGVAAVASSTRYFDARDVSSVDPLVFANGAQTLAGAKRDAVAEAVYSVSPVCINGVPCAAGGSETVWGNVSAVRLWLLVKNSVPEPAPYTNTNTYTMGDVSYTPPVGDRFRRQVFTSTVQLRN
ncbi:MAG: PilW family protein [Sideroxydans sp.]|nr:PilW family protein [Sideroxydans sp.]